MSSPRVRISKKHKRPGQSGPNAYYYMAFLNDATFATIWHTSKGWWNSWYRMHITVTEEDRQVVSDFVARLNAGEEL